MIIKEDLFDRVYQSARAMGSGLNAKGQVSKYSNKSDAFKIETDPKYSIDDSIVKTDYGAQLFRIYADNVENVLRHYNVKSVQELNADILDEDALKLISPNRSQQLRVANNYAKGGNSPVFKDILLKGPYVSADVLRLFLAAYVKRIDGIYGSDNIVDNIKRKLSSDADVAYEQLQWVTYLLNEGVQPDSIKKITKFPQTDTGWNRLLNRLNKGDTIRATSTTKSLLNQYKKWGYDISSIEDKIKTSKGRTVDISENNLKNYFWIIIMNTVLKDTPNKLNINVDKLTDDLVSGKTITVPDNLPKVPNAELGKFKDRIQAYSEISQTGINPSKWDSLEVSNKWS